MGKTEKTCAQGRWQGRGVRGYLEFQNEKLKEKSTIVETSAEITLSQSSPQVLISLRCLGIKKV